MRIRVRTHVPDKLTQGRVEPAITDGPNANLTRGNLFGKGTQPNLSDDLDL